MPQKTPNIEKQTSSHWLHDEEFKNLRIVEPLGWDANNWEEDFYKLEITREEFTIRLLKSKIKVIK